MGADLGSQYYEGDGTTGPWATSSGKPNKHSPPPLPPNIQQKLTPPARVVPHDKPARQAARTAWAAKLTAAAKRREVLQQTRIGRATLGARERRFNCRGKPRSSSVPRTVRSMPAGPDGRSGVSPPQQRPQSTSLRRRRTERALRSSQWATAPERTLSWLYPPCSSGREAVSGWLSPPRDDFIKASHPEQVASPWAMAPVRRPCCSTLFSDALYSAL
eukprot:SAG11_NODE_1711_length_4401_cov_4.188052_4_plen_217_part_00